MPISRRRPALYELTVARMKEFLREPEAVFWVFFFPMALAVALGFAFREKPPDRTPVGVVSGAGADAAAAALGRSALLLPRVMPEAAGREALRTGKISLLVEPGPPAVFHFDETRPDSRIARLAADDALQRGAGRSDPLAVREAKISEPGARYIDFLIPGLLGMNLMSTGVWSIAFAVTTARNRKLLKRLLATPMRKSDYLLSHMLARLVFLVFEIVFLIGFGWIFFGVAVRGSILLLLAICLISALSFCGLGLLVASRVSTVEGASGLANLVLLPMWIVSGVFFSSERFPDAIQPLIHALPLTAVNEALRGVINEAQGIAGIAPQMAIVLAWGLVSFAVALKIFRWR
jgi:ABC transporter DrrB family efflux protein